MTTPSAKVPKAFRENLLKAIAQVDRPGSIHTSRDLPLTMPGLEIDGVGPVRFPLGKTQARAMIKLCAQAPYGKGTDTVVDTSVRRVWELDPSRFRLTNPKWDELVASITDEARVALGLEQNTLAAHLYKLLLYEKGSFFLAHRDGEKLDGMVATLVIGLPSPHSGGELILTHEGKRHEVTLEGAASGLELSYVAFYADCEHEVRPVREGYRLCLTYNLTLRQSRAKKGVTAPRTGPVVDSIAKMLSGWPSSGDLSKLAVTLEHQYTQDGLNVTTLKGADRARADVLFDAAERAGCVAHLALITHWQSGSAEDDGYSYGRGYGRGGHRSWSHDDESGEGTGHVMEEVFDESLSISHWSDRDGNPVPFGEMTLDNEEIVSDQPREDWSLGREEYEGYTGNAGMTLERWYHRAAIVIWPKDRHFKVLCDAGTDAAIAGLNAMVRSWKSTPKSDREPLRSQCLAFAAAILGTWAPRQFRYDALSTQVPADRSAFRGLLQDLDAPDLVRTFLAEVLAANGDLQIDKGFLPFCKKHGWSSFQDSLATIVDRASLATVARNAALLEILCVPRGKDAALLGVCKHLAEHAVAALATLDAKKSEGSWGVRAVDRPAMMRALVKSLISIEAAEPLARLIDHTLAHEDRYDLTGVHVAVILALEPAFGREANATNPVISRWLARCRSGLEQRASTAPVPPADFRRANNKVSCRCADCLELSRFLDDPSEPVHHFRVREDRRRHLRDTIDNNRCDLVHVTTQTGSPHTLVCTKTDASYQAAFKIYSRDRENIQRLVKVEEKLRRSV